MARPLRAFLALRDDSGDWVVHVSRDLDEVVSLWVDAQAQGRTGVLHVGFDRPMSSAFESVAVDYHGLMLLTAAARYALPVGQFSVAETPAAVVDNIPVYLGVRGWGYDGSDLKVVESPHGHKTAGEPFVATGWVGEVVSSGSALGATLASAGIYDEQSYHEFEERLTRVDRALIAHARAVQIWGPDRNDVTALARAMPPWVLTRALASMDITVRMANVFTHYNIKTVGDLAGLDDNKLRRFRNLGTKTIYQLIKLLWEAVSAGPVAPGEIVPAKSQHSLVVEIRSSVARLGPREKAIVAWRTGLNGKPMTLQDIAERMGVTRERVRQMELKGNKAISKHAVWDEILIGKLSSLVLGRETPLPLQGLEALDNWFAEIDRQPHVLRYVLANVCNEQFTVMRIKDLEYVTRMTGTEWADAITRAGSWLENVTGDGISESDCRDYIRRFQPHSGPEFGEMLWAEVSRQCQFAVGADGTRRLVAYGNTIENMIMAILEEAAAPMHYSEIARIASSRLGRNVTPASAHGAAGRMGVLLGPGTYGAPSHVGPSERECEILRDWAETLVADGVVGKIWHTEEILASLIENDLVDDELRASKYELNHILSESKSLKSCGRMKWISAERTSAATQFRDNLDDAVVAVLSANGGPLAGPELRRRIRETYGLRTLAQIQINDPIIKVTASEYGLNDRDIALKRPDQERFLDAIVDHLRERSVGIHVTECGLLIATNLFDISPQTVFSLANQDERMSVSVGRYLYLSDWGGARRLSVSEAIRQIADEAVAPLANDDVVTRVEALTGLLCSRQHVARYLAAIGAQYDKGIGKWRVVPHSESYEDIE